MDEEGDDERDGGVRPGLGTAAQSRQVEASWHARRDEEEEGDEADLVDTSFELGEARFVGDLRRTTGGRTARVSSRVRQREQRERARSGRRVRRKRAREKSTASTQPYPHGGRQASREEVARQLRRVDTLLVLLSKGRRRKTEKEKDFFQKPPVF